MFVHQGVLAHVVTKTTKWNVHAHLHDMGTFVNMTDEAFARALLEYNCAMFGWTCWLMNGIRTRWIIEVRSECESCLNICTSYE